MRWMGTECICTALARLADGNSRCRPGVRFADLGEYSAELSKATRVCSYDRAGFGWSDPRPDPRDADHIVAELHGLLSAAAIAGPIVLIGHSIAGLYIRDYTARYPANVAGLVFVDASTPLQDDRFPAELETKLPGSSFLN